MSKKPLDSVLKYLRRVALTGHGGASDAHLLESFARQGDEAAFERLVRLHGPMVLGLCQRLLRHEQDAEDAFQATFLILARKASRISKKESLASWLYKVACRVAWRSRGRELTNRAAVLGQVAAKKEADGRELRGVLDDEIANLAESYRRPIVLCYLQGKTIDQAARLLECPAGTVASRLARAKEQLRRRLSRRGWTLSTAALAAVLADKALAVPLPAGLVGSTLAYVSGKSANTGALSAKVFALSEGVLRMMWLNKLKMAAGVVLAMVLASTGVGLVVRQTWAEGGAGQAGNQQPAARGQKANPQADTQQGTTAEIADLRKEVAALDRKLDAVLKEIKRLTQKGGKGGFRPPPDELPLATAKKEAPSQEKERNSIASLFDGIPADLRSKVIGNRVRRDRVNDWLQENVNGKEKAIQIHVSVNVVVPRRADDGTYWTYLNLDDAQVKVLGDNWAVSAIGVNVWTKRDSFPGVNFMFEGVSAADAEKLADVKQAAIQGKVKEAKLEPLHPNDSPPYCIRLILEDVQVNGKMFTPHKRETPSKKNGFAVQ